MKKTISLLFLVFFLFGIMVACSDDSTSENTSDPDPSESDNGSETDTGTDVDNSSDGESDGERPTIEFYTNEHASWPHNEEWIVWDIMEDGANINLDITIAAEPYAESLNLVMASGDLPDLIRIIDYPSGNRYGSQGALVNLLDYIDDMPNLEAWMEQYPDATRAALSHDGKMYVSPNIGIGETNRMLWMYRKDIFDELGLQTPENWDELYTVSQELKEVYPDSYPFGFRSGTGKIRNLAPNFGIEANYYYDNESEEWRYGPVEDNYLVMIEYLNKFYEEELIPPDFLSLDTAGWQQLMSSDSSFITQDYIGRIDSFNTPNREENPDYTLVNMPPPAGFVGGEQLDHSAHINELGFSVAVTSDKKDAAIRYIDWTFSEEGRDALSWGIEGETYVEENGEKRWMKDYPSPSELRSETGLSIGASYSWFDYDSHMTLFSDEVKQAYEEDPQYDAPIVPRPAFNEEEQEIIAIQGEEIAKHRDQEIAKFIIGERDLSEWDDYVQEMENLGVQDLIALYAEAHQRMLDVELN